MKKGILLIGLCLLMCCPAVFAEEEVSIETEVTSAAAVKDDYAPQLLEEIKLQRSTIYNSLNLTPAQIQKKDEIDAKRYSGLEPKLSKLCIARKKAKETAKNGTSDKKIVNAAQREYEAAAKDIKTISNKYDKEFKKILTSEQKSKYEMIRKLKRSDLKKMQKEQENGKKQSDLRPFGEPISQASYTEQRKKKK